VFSGGPKDHVVVFHRSDDELARVVTDYLLGALENDGAAVVVTTRAHRAAIEDRLGRDGADLSAAGAAGCYVALDAADVLSQFMINDYADPAGFWRVISPVIRKASRNGGSVRVFAEMVSLMWADGRPSPAADLEALWTELTAQYSCSLLCAYPAGLLRDAERADDLAEILAGHSDVTAILSRDEDVLSQLLSD
jgi:MEDS: MEthanogen/methylotroph, DcmR Sensory domain